MPSTVTLPLWLALVAGALAAWALVDRLLLPVVHWFLRRRLERTVEEVDRRLHIRLQPFKLTRRQVLVDRLVHDPEVAAAIEEESEGRGAPRKAVQERVELYAREIVPAFNAYVYFRLGYWLSRNLARILYRVRLGSVDEQALAAVDPRSTVVFVINHRSNMDYVLVSYLVAERAALSYAVGEWARIWPLDTLVRSTGAYFVRRGSENRLYRRVLARYVEMATREGVTQAVFPEGGLSRDGSLGEPKLGLFDYMLRAFDPAGPRDLVFVPVGLNYDRVLEDRTLLLDRRPGAQPVGPLAAAARAAGFAARQLLLVLRGRWYRFGYACVSFGRPLSARAWLAERGLDPRSLPRAERFARVAELAATLMGEVERAIPALPAAIVARVFAQRPGRALAELELKAGAQRLIDELETAGRQVYVPRRDRDYAIEVGLRMLTLRRLVEERGGLYRAAPGDLDLLRYYARSLGPLAEGASPAGRASASSSR